MFLNSDFSHSLLILVITSLFIVVNCLTYNIYYNGSFTQVVLSQFPTCPTRPYVNLIFSTHEQSNSVMAAMQAGLIQDGTFTQWSS